MHRTAIRSILLTALVAALLTGMLSPTAAAGTQERFTVPLEGSQVVPGPGDPDGAGGVFIFMDRQTGRFCFFADTANISTPLTGVHLHHGQRGNVGEVIATLHGPSTDPDVSGCLDLDRDRVRDISKMKENYYIDIHNEEFPDGALRAQLE